MAITFFVQCNVKQSQDLIKPSRYLQLFDVYGQMIKTIALSGGSETYTLSVQDFMPGIYFWQASSGCGQHAKGRLVVQH